MKKKFVSTTILVFHFTTLYQILYKPAHWVKSMFDIIFLLIFIAPKSVSGGFLRGAIFFLKKYTETNISAKFDAFIRDVNVWLIFDHSQNLYTNRTRYRDCNAMIAMPLTAFWKSLLVGFYECLKLPQNTCT